MSKALTQPLPAHFPYALGQPLVEGAVTLFPLFAKASDDDGGAGPTLVPLSRAQDQGVVEVREVDHGAIVGEIEIVNKSEDFILVLAGTALKGGLQDRQVGDDVLLPPWTTTPVEAFCVEQGRWNPSREGVSTGAVFHALPMLTSRAVRHAATVEGDQGRVWEEVSQANTLRQVASETHSLFATLETTDSEAHAERDDAARRVRAYLTAGPPVVGVAWGSLGDGLEIRAFGSAATALAFVPILANTIAMDAQAPHGDDGSSAPLTVAHIAAAVAKAEPLSSEWAPGDRQRTERRQTDGMAYSACWYLPKGGAPQLATSSWQQVG